MSTHISTVNALAGNPVPRRRQMQGGTRGSSLGLTATQTVDLVRQIEAGLPYKALLSLAATSGLSVASIASTLGIPQRTLARRRVAGRFAPNESERLLRISTLFEKAVELFEGDVAGAVTWLTSPKRALGRQTPLAYLRTEPGAREVEALIGRLEDGVFS
jgi:putative toxin-antitoxin system antitoxin component (TIGR02293 family)